FGEERFTLLDHDDSGAGRVCPVKVAKQCINNFFICLTHRVQTQRKDLQKGKQPTLSADSKSKVTNGKLSLSPSEPPFKQKCQKQNRQMGAYASRAL
ncbi:MAG: hypothetical protein DME72_07410, partial [Verrucomicrobia bacterium]